MSDPPPGSALMRLSVSATDEEWAFAAERAERQGVSISRYLVDAALAEEDAAAPGGGDERALLEAVRRLRALLPVGADGGPSRDGMLERLAVPFATWACELAATGRGAELGAALAPALGREKAERVAAAFSPGSPVAAPKKTGKAAGGREGGRQGALF